MKLIKLLDNQYLSLLVVFTVAFFLLLFKVPLVNTGYADSDEYLVVASQWGVPRAIEYTPYTGVLNLAMKLPIPGTTPAFRAHSITLLALITALYLFSASTMIILKKLYSKKSHYYFYISAVLLAAALTLSNHHLLTYGLITGKYMSSLPALGLIYFAGVKLILEKKYSRQLLILLGVGTGLMISFHQVLLFLLPFIAYILWSVNKKKYRAYLPFIGTVVIIVIILFSLIAWRLNTAPEPSLTTANGLSGTFQLMFNTGYHGNIFYEHVTGTPYFHSITPLDNLKSIISYLSFVIKSFTWWITPVLVLGIAALIHHKHIAILILSPFVLGGILVAAYTGWTQDTISQAVITQFHTPLLITLMPLLALGFFEILERISKSLLILRFPKSYIIPATFIIPLVLVAAFLIPSLKSVNIKQFTLVNHVYSNIIKSVEPNAIISCYSDTSCYALLYEQTVNQMRLDVDVVPAKPNQVKKTLALKQLQHFRYSTDPHRIFDIVTWNVDKRPVYVVDISNQYLSLFGIDQGFLYYIPQNMYGKLSRTLPEFITKTQANDIISLLQKQKVPEFDSMRRVLVSSFIQPYINNAYIWLKIGEREQAQNELNTGVNIAYLLFDYEKNKAGNLRVEVEGTSKDDRFAYGSKTPAADEIIQHIPRLLEGGYVSRAIYLARAGLIVDPLHVESRLQLARLHLLQNEAMQAEVEFRNILMIDPQNTEAVEELKKI